MTERPKTGDRVRLATQDFEPDHLVGDMGTVESGPYPIPSGGFFYLVRMEREEPGAVPIMFRENDIEVVATADASA